MYVRLLVKYNSVVWSPHLKKDIEAVEKVQRRFTKRLPGLHALSFALALNLPSLEMRRLHIDLVWCYN